MTQILIAGDWTNMTWATVEVMSLRIWKLCHQKKIDCFCFSLEDITGKGGLNMSSLRCLGIVTGVVGLMDEQGGNTLPEQASYRTGVLVGRLM
jgi:hypothetical protein